MNEKNKRWNIWRDLLLIDRHATLCEILGLLGKLQTNPYLIGSSFCGQSCSVLSILWPSATFLWIALRFVNKWNLDLAVIVFTYVLVWIHVPFSANKGFSKLQEWPSEVLFLCLMDELDDFFLSYIHMS